MSDIFQINLEPKIDYENTNFKQIEQILKNWRLNISEEIKCLLFIKSKIELNKDNNYNSDDETCIKIDKKILEKYSKIFIKLEELCLQEINLISETLVSINEMIYNDNNNKLNEECDEKNLIFDKINLTLNNYNKIIENINKTISSLPEILNLYLLYNEIGKDENQFIRENIKDAEEKYLNENINNKICNKTFKNKNRNTGRVKTVSTQNNNISLESKRERMVRFSKSVKNKKFKTNNKYNKNKDKVKANQIKIDNIYEKENLKEMVIETEEAKNILKDYVYNNCIKENEMKNLMKMKEDNERLNEEIINIKNFIRKINDLYEYQLEKLELLKNEQNILEKENQLLCGYVNKILVEEKQKNIDFIDDDINKENIINDNNNIISEEKINNININDDSNIENNIFNISPDNFESREMLKRINKL